MGYSAVVQAVSLVLAGLLGELPPGVTWCDPIADVASRPPSFAAVFAREPAGNGDFDFIASVWEVHLEPEPVIVPRIRFVPSHWSPGLLVNERIPARADLVRLQVPVPNGYRVNLYSVDYSSWEVETVWQGAQAASVFVHGRDAYIDVFGLDPSEEGLRVVRADNRVECPPEIFRYLRPIPGHQHLHLVRRGGRAELLDADSGRFTPLPWLPHAMDNGDGSSICVSPDRAWYATHSVMEGIEQLRLDLLHEPQPVVSKVDLIETATGKRIEVPISMLMAPGSGVLAIYTNPLLGFDRGGHLLVRHTPASVVDGQAGFPEPCVFALDPRTGLREDLLDASGVIQPVDPPRDRFIAPVPESMKAFLEDEVPREVDVAIAFLRSQGIDHDSLSAYRCAVDFSDDQLVFLLKSEIPGLDSVFFVGDLRSGSLVKIPAPQPLIRANDMNLLILDRSPKASSRSGHSPLGLGESETDP